MKVALAFATSGLALLGAIVPASAFAQDQGAPGGYETAQPQDQQAAPPAEQPSPSPQTIQPQGQNGQWVQTGDAGWVWVPEGTSTYAVNGVPYAYLYTPTYGWTW